jgi:prepilin-type N-terminal cleavage/methylation domain-containing protein
MMKNNRGFTLVEMLIVIAVIAVLLGIIIPRFKGMQQEANITKAKAELKTLQTATESWFIHSTPQAYPATSATPCATYFDTATPSIVSAPLYDPFAAPSTEYNYAVSPAGAYYVIWSVGPNGTAITGISDAGAVTGVAGTDVYVTNGPS